MVETVALIHTVKQDCNITKLVAEMLVGNIGEIKPTIDLASGLGFTYPQVEGILGLSTEEVITIVELLANEDVLGRQFYDKLLICPYCQSPNLRHDLICPKCSSKNIAKGRILEHFTCANIGLEDEYVVAGRYMCPKCKKELRFLGTDYRSLGVNYKCHHCGKVSSKATLKWQCLKCALSFVESEASETVLYSYQINGGTKASTWLEFEIGPKAKFIEFLKDQGYEVIERARVNSTSSKSGAEHTLDILAQRNDGFVTYTIGVGVVIDSKDDEVSLGEVFRFDDKAYDLGIHDKVLLVVHGLSQEAKQFAQRQRIKVVEDKDLENFLSSAVSSPPRQVIKEPFEFETKTKLLGYLKSLGYVVEEKARVRGRSGAEYTLDVLASNDDGIIAHTLSIGILIAENEVNLDAVSSFDTKAYDIGIHDKVLLVSPRLSPEARQFAQQQKIKVIEVENPAALA